MSPEDDERFTATILVPLDHPAIPGHFPGDPVVPGVLILEELLLATGRWLGTAADIRRLQQAKFLAPLRPGEEAVIDLARRGHSLQFSVRRGTDVIAKGAFGIEAQSAS
jgi:3-hydroxymyristoyl/3-hydroxydecanoyl-(acyl carrier protein) dehydratase